MEELKYVEQGVYGKGEVFFEYAKSVGGMGKLGKV
jgi:hypothetical protein